MTTGMIDHILDLAQQLPREQRQFLLARLERELAAEGRIPQPPMSPEQARNAWKRLQSSMHALPSPRRSAGEQLTADRWGRDQALLGYPEESSNVDT